MCTSMCVFNAFWMHLGPDLELLENCIEGIKPFFCCGKKKNIAVAYSFYTIVCIQNQNKDVL